MNVGAETQNEIGDYFAWGEVTPKERYDTESYKWYDNETKKYTKYGYYDRDYCIEPDDRFKLISADDAALHNSNRNNARSTRQIGTGRNFIYFLG